MLAEISRALEQRDRTRGHGDRVTALAEALALRLGWTEDRLGGLRRGGPLHDIGKVAVPAEILAKRTPLSTEELAQIRRHPTAGATLVEPIRSARSALPYVLYHHERWDGRGYPDGLTGEEIPLPARVLAVADTLDAMTSARAYRTGLPWETALDEIRRYRGTQFDPQVVDAWERVLPRLAAHYENFRHAPLPPAQP